MASTEEIRSGLADIVNEVAGDTCRRRPARQVVHR